VWCNGTISANSQDDDTGPYKAVCYRDFCDDVNAVFTKYNLEKLPLARRCRCRLTR